METRRWRTLFRRFCRCWGRNIQVHAIVPGNNSTSVKDEPHKSFQRVESWEELPPLKPLQSTGQLPSLPPAYRSSIATQQARQVPTLKTKPPLYVEKTSKRPSSRSSISFCESSLRGEVECPPAPQSQRAPSSLELQSSPASVASAGSDRELFREMAEEMEMVSH